MILVDTHCHLYLPAFNEDRSEMMQRAKEKGVERFYLPGIDSDSIADMLRMEAEWPGACFPMMGLHPCSVQENYHAELQLVEEWLSKRTFAAVGEIGLDFYWDKTRISQQYEAFRLQMEWALQYQLPIVIHSRNAMRECVDAVRPFAAKGLTGIFHCFGESLELAREIISLGFYLGIGGVITYQKSGLAQVVAELPLESLVLETDAPYLTPVPHRGKRNESSYLSIVAQKLAECKNLEVAEVAEVTTRNANKVFCSTL